jgi:hypothetical protein
MPSSAFYRTAEGIKANPRVSLLFSNPIGSGLNYNPIVLVQGTAKIYDEDFVANLHSLTKYIPEFIRKQPKSAGLFDPGFKGWFFRKLMGWYMYRIIIEVTPDNILGWKDGNLDQEPQRIKVKK